MSDVCLELDPCILDFGSQRIWVGYQKLCLANCCPTGIRRPAACSDSPDLLYWLLPALFWTLQPPQTDPHPPVWPVTPPLGGPELRWVFYAALLHTALSCLSEVVLSCVFFTYLFLFFFKQLYMIFLRLLNQNLVLWSICSGQLCIPISA